MRHAFYSLAAIVRRTLLALIQKIDTPREPGADNAPWQGQDFSGLNLEQSEVAAELGPALEDSSLPVICAKVALPVRIVAICRDLLTAASKPGEEPASLNCRSTILAYSPMGDAAPEGFRRLGIHDPPSEEKALHFVNAETMRLLTGVIHHN